MFFFAAFLCFTNAYSDVTLPTLFMDHMVLQQAKTVPVWGWAEDGEEVTVSFQGNEESTIAEDGKWRVNLRKTKTGGPFELTVRGNNSITIQDVLVGEVWLCGGQSNMQWTVSNSTDSEETVANSANDQIRLFQVPMTSKDEPQDNVDASWKVCGPESLPNFSAVAYNFGRKLQEDLGVPVGLIQSCVGGSNVSSWVPRDLMANNPEFKNFTDEYDAIVASYPEIKKEYEAQLAAYQAKVEEYKAKGEKLPDDIKAPRLPYGPEHHFRISGFYNGMIVPLKPYAIAGAIWYQGESNAGSPTSSYQYRNFFPAMINHWREIWGQGDFPFLFVQLASWGVSQGDPWPLLREAQTMTLNQKNTGMAVAIDVGDEKDIHPKDKKTVGERLELAALEVAYDKDVAYSGPIYKSMKVKGNEVRLSFEHTDDGLMFKGDNPVGFVIAGEDMNFVDATARIDGKYVYVSSDAVANPVAVRYGWSAYTECNLYNGAGLPASPFRTDDTDLWQ
jgi:sialate O-acetylesterase